MAVSVENVWKYEEVNINQGYFLFFIDSSPLKFIH